MEPRIEKARPEATWYGGSHFQYSQAAKCKERSLPCLFLALFFNSVQLLTNLRILMDGLRWKFSLETTETHQLCLHGLQWEFLSQPIHQNPFIWNWQGLKLRLGACKASARNPLFKQYISAPPVLTLVQVSIHSSPRQSYQESLPSGSLTAGHSSRQEVTKLSSIDFKVWGGGAFSPTKLPRFWQH